MAGLRARQKRDEIRQAVDSVGKSCLSFVCSRLRVKQPGFEFRRLTVAAFMPLRNREIRAAPRRIAAGKWACVLDFRRTDV